MTTTNPPTAYEQQNPPAHPGKPPPGQQPDHMTGAELQTLREAAGKRTPEARSAVGGPLDPPVVPPVARGDE